MTLRNVTDFMSRSCPHFDTCSVPKKKSYLKSVKQLAHKYCTKKVKQQKKELNCVENLPPPTPIKHRIQSFHQQGEGGNYFSPFQNYSASIS